MKSKLGLLLNRQQRNIKKVHKAAVSIDASAITTEKIIQILEKPEKSMSDISALKYYCLNKSNLISKFTEDKLDETSYELILSLSLPSSSIKTFKKNKIIINIGEPNDYLHIIVKGRASLLGIKKFHIEVTGYEYFLLIRDLKKNHDTHLIEKMVTENYRVFPVDYEDITFLEKIMLKIYLSGKIKRTSPNYLEEILDKVGLNLSNFNMVSYMDMIEKKYAGLIEAQEDVVWEELTESEKIEKYRKLMIYDLNEEWHWTLQNEKNIYDQLNFIDIDMMKKYTYLTKTKEEELIIYYKSEFIDEIGENEYFGNSEHKIYINKVVALTDEVKIMCLKADLYNEYVRKINYKVIGNQINFLLDNFFFHPLYKGFFEKYYFKYFELVEYKIKQIIVKENEPVQYCYFIKSGSVKLKSNRSIAENHILIEIIKNILLKSNKNENNINENIKLDMKNLYNNVANNLEYFSDDMNVKNNAHIMTLQSNNCIGSCCMHYGFNFLYTAEVNSEIVELYKIPVDKLMRILNDKTSKVFYYFDKYNEQSLKLFFDRLTRLNNMLLANLNKSKIRQYGNIFNLNVENFQEGIYKNDIKFSNKIDKLSFETLKNSDNINSRNSNSTIKYQNQQQSIEKDKDSDKMNFDIKDINNNLFITQKTSTSNYNKLNNAMNPTMLKKNVDEKKNKKNANNNKEDKKENLTQKIIENLKRSNSLNLFPFQSDSTKDLTSHIKFFDYKENLEKQKEKEEKRANLGLIRLEKHEKNQLQKLKNLTKTYTNWLNLSLGKNRNLIMSSEKKNNDEKNNNNEYSSFSSNNNIIDLYNRDVFKRTKMIMTSLYKNKFSEYFDKKLGSKYFKYDMSKTLLTNKKKFEFSIFDKRFNSVPKKRNRKRFNNLLNIKKNKIQNQNKKNLIINNKITQFDSLKIIPIKGIN